MLTDSIGKKDQWQALTGHQSMAPIITNKWMEKLTGSFQIRAKSLEIQTSVPARLGKGQGAKEIGHNLACERPKFEHNLVRKRHKIGHSLEREWPSEAHFYAWKIKIRWQSSTRMKLGLGTILWAIDENMGTNLQAVTSIFTSAVWKHKNSNYIL